MNKVLSKDELAALTMAERLRLIEQIWDSLETRDETMPLPDWQVPILDARVAEHARDPGGPWTEVEADLWARLRK
ncbi:MAG: addiction module protein [Hyphomicrobiaceae bacterium]|nr:addiction module protein [Hyphomicrobiaceae bacterium]